MVQKSKLMFFAGFMVMLFGCGAQKAGMYISVDGKEFSTSELLVDGSRVGKSKQLVTKPTGEIYVDGVFYSKGPSATLIQKQDSFSGSFEYFGIVSGEHKFKFVSDSGSSVEFMKEIKPGENYISINIKDDKIEWNDEECELLVK